MSAPVESCRTWVIDHRVDAATYERLGDARQLADARSESVGALIVGACRDPEALIAAGADWVKIVEPVGSAGHVARCGSVGRTANAEAILAPFRPRVVLASGSPDGREWAARLAVRRLKPGVAEAMPPELDRTATVERIGSLEVGEETVRVEREIPADPSEVDIRHADRIVAGGRGLGGADGFQRLARVASVLKAAVAASRVAVDHGWIDRERQVGQTGKTIAPALYLACGISGASHHLAGIAAARHIVAINTDPNAPIFKAAHLALVADLHEVLSQVEAQLAAAPRSAG